VADKKHRTVLKFQCALHGGYIVSKRGKGEMYGCDVKAFLLQEWNEFIPA
jgi:hypothetical protein